MKKILAWYFSEESRRLRYGDNRPIVLGKEHIVWGTPEPCKRGLHGSINLLDALEYAPGSIVWRVELSGRIKKGDDKIAATRRRYIAGGIDVYGVLREFARKQALSVAHLWDMPAIVREYLETGDESKRAEAISAVSAIESPKSATKSAISAISATRSTVSAILSATWVAVLAAESAERAETELKAKPAAWLDARAVAWSAANEMLTNMVELAIKQGGKANE